MWNCDGSWIEMDLEPHKSKYTVDAAEYAFTKDLLEKASGNVQPQIYLNLARANGKTLGLVGFNNRKYDNHILSQSELLFKSLTQEDYKQMAAMETAIENVRKAIERDWIRQPVNKFFDIKSIEVSADHRTVVVVWADGETTKVVRSENDPDDIYMAFTAALAKKLYGSNSAIKRTISKKVNQHKPKEKKETVGPRVSMRGVVWKKKKEETE